MLLVLLGTSAALGLSETVLAAWGPRPSYQAHWHASLPYFELDPLYLYRVRPHGVLLGIYAENDFNDLYKNRVFVYAEDGSLTPNAENPVRSTLPPTHLEPFLRRALTGHYLEPSREQELATLLLSDTRDLLALETGPVKQTKVFMMRSILRAFAVDLRASAVPLFVIVIPSLANVQDPTILDRLGVSPEDAFVNETTVARLAAGARIPVLDLSQPLLERRAEGLYQPEDNHFTPHGNAVAAELVSAWLKGQGF